MGQTKKENVSFLMRQREYKFSFYHYPGTINIKIVAKFYDEFQ